MLLISQNVDFSKCCFLKKRFGRFIEFLMFILLQREGRNIDPPPRPSPSHSDLLPALSDFGSFLHLVVLGPSVGPNSVKCRNGPKAPSAGLAHWGSSCCQRLDPYHSFALGHGGCKSGQGLEWTKCPLKAFLVHSRPCHDLLPPCPKAKVW